MKKKYVVYSMISCFDDYGCLHFNWYKAGEYTNEEEANAHAYEIRNMCYGVKIEELEVK